MGGTRGMHGKEQKHIYSFGSKSEEDTPLEIPRRRCEDNIKMVLK
jgi:hypothetical protein